MPDNCYIRYRLTATPRSGSGSLLLIPMTKSAGVNRTVANQNTACCKNQLNIAQPCHRQSKVAE